MRASYSHAGEAPELGDDGVPSPAIGPWVWLNAVQKGLNDH